MRPAKTDPDVRRSRLIGFVGRFFGTDDERISKGSDMPTHPCQDACRLAELEAEIARLRTLFRVNILRLAPETSHAEIDRVLYGEPDH